MAYVKKLIIHDQIFAPLQVFLGIYKGCLGNWAGEIFIWLFAQVSKILFGCLHKELCFACVGTIMSLCVPADVTECQH